MQIQRSRLQALQIQKVKQIKGGFSTQSTSTKY